METKELGFLLALHRALHLTQSRYECLGSFFQKKWSEAWKASPIEFAHAGIEKKGQEKFFAQRENISPDEELEKFSRCGAQVFCVDDDDYPALLKNIYSPPALLFVRGEMPPQDTPSLSVVGSRRMTSYGKRCTESIVGEVARNGITIVSGLAFGVDTCAHKAAVDAGGQTICVLGNGIDAIYPASNKNFAEGILQKKQGAILSEHLPGVEARAEFFPLRNRIIAGLSMATLVVEAAEKSGSLITAELALGGGRDVFAVPGDIFSKASAGTNALIRAGAIPVESGKQILEYFGISETAAKENNPSINMTKEEKEIFRAFGEENRVHINDILRLSPLPAPVTSAQLSLMEIKGLVKNIGNQMYVRNI